MGIFGSAEIRRAGVSARRNRRLEKLSGSPVCYRKVFRCLHCKDKLGPPDWHFLNRSLANLPPCYSCCVLLPAQTEKIDTALFANRYAPYRPFNGDCQFRKRFATVSI